MPASPSVSTKLRQFAETAVIATLCGAALGLAGVPAGWLSGAVVGVAVSAVAGRVMYIPRLAQMLTLFTIGVSLGSVVTPETLRGIATWPTSIAFLVVAVVCMLIASATYLRFVHRWEPLSAVLASVPGALSQVMVVSIHIGADLRRIVIVQTIRVVILTVGLPTALASFGFVGGPAVLMRGATSFEPLQLSLLIATCAVVAGVMMWIRFPGGLLFGAMIASAALHGAGLLETRLPSWLLIVGMVALGAMIGARFTNTDFRSVMRFVGAGIGSFLVSLAVAAVFVGALITMLTLRVADAAVAFAPGALDAMMILALALHLDPIYVGAHHLARFLVSSLALPILVRMFGGERRAAPPTVREPIDTQD